MKKTIIIGVATMLLLSGSPVYAKSDEHGEKENHRNNNKKTVVVSATTTAQITSIKQQIEDLNKQLKELKRTSKVSGQTIKHSDDDTRMSITGMKNSCARFMKEHRRWKWNSHGHRGWYRALDQHIPTYCTKLPGYSTSTLPVIDITAPVISGIVATGVSSTSETVNWTTNEGATSKIFISTTSPVLTSGTPAWTDGATTTAHGVQLVGLIPNTTYYFIVSNTDIANNTRVSAQGSFVTMSGSVVDITAPTISSVAVGSLSTSSATIGWNTSESATAKLFLSTSSPVGTTTSVWADTGLATVHNAPATGLLPNTTYFFVVQATDASLNSSFSAQGSFTTGALDVLPPVITALSVVPTGSTTATATWTTNEVADSTVYFSSTSPVVIGTATMVNVGTLLTSHSVNLSGLTASTTYYVVVRSKDSTNNTSTSSQTSFTTSN